MKNQLFIRISSDEKSLQWGTLSGAEDSTESGFVERGDLLIEDVETLAETLEESQVILMLPAHRVKCFNVEAPTKNRKHLEKAIPYQLEEQILDNVDNQHFALGAFNADSLLAVNVVSKEYLSELLTTFKEVGIEPDVVVSEAVCVPYFEDSWTAVIDEQILVRQQENVFWSSDRTLIKDLLQLELQADELKVTQAIRIYSYDDEELSLASVAGLATQPETIDDVFLCLAENFDDNSVNILQQDFASQKKSQHNYGMWKLPAIAASILAVVGLIYLVSHIIDLNKRLSSVEQQTLAQTQKVYPNLPLKTAKIQVNNSYHDIGGSEGSGVNFTGLMEKSVLAMKTENIQFSQMEYLASRGQLSFDVTADSYEVLTQSQRNLEGAGLEVDMRNASENGGIWTARISVGAKK